MSKIMKVRKLLTTQAVQITDGESEAIVRGWLAQMGMEKNDLSELIENRVYFMRDEGDEVVYLVHPADFLTQYEEIEVEEIEDDGEHKDFHTMYQEVQQILRDVDTGKDDKPKQ